MRQILTISLTILAILLFSPLMFLIAVCIFLEDRGSIFFLQERIGLREIPFQAYKFRTMRNGKVTRVGNILRITGLDELAQLFNILLGDMNIVGPRPLTKYDIERLGWNQYKYIKRFSVKPGLTGLAQIYGGRGARISKCFEFSYLKLQSLGMDLQIILITFFMNFFGKQKIRRLLWKELKLRKRHPNWNKWLKHFKKNALGPNREGIESISTLSDERLIALRRSLAIFQLGEAGEGRIAKQIEGVFIFGVNKTYRECVKLFVKEEGKHGRLLALMVRSLGGKLLEHNWTESLFGFGRRLLGIRLKLLVLLAAEAVSVAFYKIFIRELPLSGMRAALIEITRDEEFHLRFHQEFFKIRIDAILYKFSFKILWRFIALAAFIVVILDHRKSLVVFEVSLSRTYEDYFKIVRNVEEEICNSKKNKNADYANPLLVINQ
jgi:lipopolysaccharide/colanic/teichoic acid biosynthesis glycosyltransferase